MAIRQIINITLELFALGRGDNSKTQLGSITVVAYPFTVYLKLETANVGHCFGLDFQLIPDIQLYIRHAGTFHAASGNTDIFK